MKIHFERSGGFAGLRLATTVDTETLPEDQARALKDALREADFYQLPTQIKGPQGGADRFNYQIMVEEAGGTHTVEVGEAAMPENMQPLVDLLSRLARTR